ncbi:hypothetical protein ABZ318_17930 [Streptomyces sp. NPDC006197]|uniref:hypothetical protein n=1 Tax=Streptomyces sp. NPDC006197 TaxID=3156685 RepID=UPI0033B0F13D
MHRSGHWIDDEGLHRDDGGCTWWVMSPMGDGRYVLYGEDESSKAKWHEPPVDMLAGSPAWLPWDELRDRLPGNELGCVYWYENGAWARAPYPDSLDDDGLDCGMGALADHAQAVELLAERLAPVDDGPGTDALRPGGDRSVPGRGRAPGTVHPAVAAASF